MLLGFRENLVGVEHVVIKDLGGFPTSQLNLGAATVLEDDPIVLLTGVV